MNQTQRRPLNQKVKQQLRQVVICKNRDCRRVFGYQPGELITRPIDDYVSEVGIACPACGLWHRAYWMNTDLIKLRQAVGSDRLDRKAGRRFTHEFKKFQSRMAKKSRVALHG